MSKKCSLTGKGVQVGHRVSHSNIKTKHRFEPNLQTHRFLVEENGIMKRIKMRLSTQAIRLISRKGIEAVLAKLKGRVN